ncbi:acyl-CoA thioesterase [Micromonospora sp. NPDC005087]|uniref:acyl-CoA thioesterase n=1 Tax=Micromonospora sp. NPDC005087 TaxID=3364225 RepID=UPI00368981D2
MTEPYRCTVPVRFADLDAFGHVNHTRHLTFCEEHRNRFFAAWADECGTDPLDDGLVVARIECDYLRPVSRRTACVEVAMLVNAVGRSSLSLSYEISDGDSVVARIKSVLVMVKGDGMSRPLDDAERRFATRYQAPEDR